MSDDIASVKLPVEESGVNIEAGETVTGEVTGTELREFEYDGDDITYYVVKVVEDQSGIEFTPDYPARVTEGTGLGQLLQRFGASLTLGEEIDPSEYFEVGTRVAFEVDEEEGDDGQTFLRAVEASLRPEGQIDEKPAEVMTPNAGNGAASDEDEDDDSDSDKAAVMSIIAEEGLEGQSLSNVKSSIAQQNGALLKAFNELIDEGELDTEEDGEGETVVFIA